jgi:hypothetical protein
MQHTSQDLASDPCYQNLDQRLTRISLVLGLSIASGAALLFSWNFLASFAVGAVISYLNFSWMKQGIDHLISTFGEAATLQHGSLASSSEIPAGENVPAGLPEDRILPLSQRVGRARRRASRKVIFKYFLRYALIGGILYAIVRFRFFDAAGVILGLLLYVAAVLFECIYLVIRTLFEEGYGRT